MKYLSLAALFAASAVGAFAGDDSSNGSSQPTAPSIQHPQQDEMYGFSLSGEALYWKSMIQAPIPATEVNVGSLTGAFPQTTTGVNWSFNWAWGYRLAADYRFDDCNWGLGLEYTQLYAHANLSHTSATGNNLLIPGNAFFTQLGNASNASYVSGIFDNKMNGLDGLLERKYEVGDFVCFYPAFGVKGVWFRQNNTTTFTGGAIPVGQNITQKSNHRYYAAGPKVALSSQWDLGCGFGFYEDLGFSLLLGNFHRSSSQIYSVTPATNTTTTNLGNYFELVPAIELKLGLNWVYHFEEVAQCLGLNVGVDAQSYLNEYFSSTLVRYGNSSYFGISFGAFWKF